MNGEQLAHYREVLTKLQTQIMSEVRKAAQRMADQSATPDELSHVPTHPADRDTEGLDSDMVLESNYEQILESIEVAFERIDKGTYGRCIDCGGLIPKARLDLLPFTLRCVECESKHEQSSV